MSIARIRRLNDAFRYWVIRLHLAGRTAAAARFGRIVVTSGVAALGDVDIETVLRVVMNFRSFTNDNDPYEEHDFGALANESTRILWKIDYYAPDLCHGSEDPADPKKTARLLTIMLAAEYGNMRTLKSGFRKPAFVHCGCCELYHPLSFTGDCRDDANRYTADDLDQQLGSGGWDLCEAPRTGASSPRSNFW